MALFLGMFRLKQKINLVLALVLAKMFPVIIGGLTGNFDNCSMISLTHDGRLLLVMQNGHLMQRLRMPRTKKNAFLVFIADNTNVAFQKYSTPMQKVCTHALEIKIQNSLLIMALSF